MIIKVPSNPKQSMIVWLTLTFRFLSPLPPLLLSYPVPAEFRGEIATFWAENQICFFPSFSHPYKKYSWMWTLRHYPLDLAYPFCPTTMPFLKTCLGVRGVSLLRNALFWLCLHSNYPCLSQSNNPFHPLLWFLESILPLYRAHLKQAGSCLVRGSAAAASWPVSIFSPIVVSAEGSDGPKGMGGEGTAASCAFQKAETELVLLTTNTGTAMNYAFLV